VEYARVEVVSRIPICRGHHAFRCDRFADRISQKEMDLDT
jgi:hypothetical protein